jgi:iron complex transport system substrate-binding protein
MNNKEYAIIAVAILAVSGVGIAFYALNDDGDGAEGATVTDALGRTVEIPEEIDSIFCREAGSLRLVSYFSSVEKVKGLEARETFNELDDQTYYLVYKERFESLPRIALDAESIIQHDPDIIITSMTDVASVDNLETQTNITVYAVNGGYQFGDDYYRQLQDLGKLFGEEGRAQQLVDGTKALIGDISSKVTSVNDSKAYACGMFYYGNAKFIKGTGNYQPFDFSHVYNVMPEAANKEPYQVTKETVISYNPDVIFIDSIEIDSILAEISGDMASYDDINAVKNSRLYSTMVYKCYYNNWENQLVNAFYVADVLNGDLYTWDFETKADEVMELYYPGMDVTYAQIAAVQGGCGAVALAD